MPTTIPADPSLVLGYSVDPQKLLFLEDIAEAQKPQDLAQDTLNALIVSTRNLESIYTEMLNMNVPQEDLDNLQDEIDKLKVETSKAAVDLGMATVATVSAVRDIKSQAGQSKVSVGVTSPLDWNQSTVKPLPLSSDAMNFDVQYFRHEENDQKMNATAKSVQKFVMDSLQGELDQTDVKNVADSTHNNVASQTGNHAIEGVIVITANCTHRMAQVIDPFILEPMKALHSWNEMFPEDPILTAADKIYGYALDNQQGSIDGNTMQILSGATYGSSFVGMVFFKQTEQIDTTQSSEALAETMRENFTNVLATREQAGEFGAGEEMAKAAKALSSFSDIENHCSLITHGIIPNIAANNVKSTVANLKPDPQEIMAQLGAIQGASNAVANESMEAMATKAKQGQQFMSLNSDYLANAVSAVGAYDTESNQTMDMSSLMTAFTDYVQKAMSGEGVGTPTKFFLRDITKADIAMSYISKYYPNGATSQMEALRGQTGQEATSSS